MDQGTPRHAHAAGPSGQPYLDFKGLQEISPVSGATLRRRIRDGHIPAFQPGGPGTKLYFPADVFDRLRRAGQAVLAPPPPPTFMTPPQTTQPPTTTSTPPTVASPKRRSGPTPKWMAE